MSPTIWVHATTMNPYLQYMRLYENNRVEFHNKLKDSIGTVAERVFWRTLFARRDTAVKILSEHAAILLTDEGMYPKISLFFKNALNLCPTEIKAQAAAELYNELDPLEYLKMLQLLLIEPKANNFTNQVIKHILSLQNEKTFSLLFRALLHCILAAPAETASIYFQQIHVALPQDKLLSYYEREWPLLPLIQQCRLIPLLPIPFVVAKLAQGTKNTFFAWLSTFISSLKSISARSIYFQQALIERSAAIRLEDLIRTATSYESSSLHLHILTDLSAIDFDGLMSLDGLPFTEFLYSTCFFKPEEAQHLHLMLREDSLRRNRFLNQMEIHIYDHDGRVGIETPAAFRITMENAFKNQRVDGELISDYIERLETLPWALWVIYASDPEYYTWILTCMPYLSSKALHYLSWVFTPFESKIAVQYLLNQQRFREAAAYFKRASEEAQTDVLADLVDRYQTAHSRRLCLEHEFSLIPLTASNYDPLFNKLQEILAIRREIEGPLTPMLKKVFTKTPKKHLQKGINLIQQIVAEVQETTSLWTGKGSLSSQIYALAPDDEAFSVSALPPYLLEQLNSRIFDICNLESAESLPLLGLTCEADFSALGLSKDLQLEVEKIEMELNLIGDDPPPEVAIVWEAIKAGRSHESCYFPDQIDRLKELLGIMGYNDLYESEEINKSFKLKCIILRALAIYGLSEETKAALNDLYQRGAPLTETFTALVRFVKDHSFENRLIAYLRQNKLCSIWEEWREGGEVSLHAVMIRRNLSGDKLYQLNTLFQGQ